MVWLNTSVYAQTKREMSPPILVSYYAPYGVQIGGKIGTEVKLKTWKKVRQDGSEATSALLIQPQIGYFVKPGLRKSLLLETAFSYPFRKMNRRTYIAPSIAFGYLIGWENTEGSVNLGSGEIEQITETSHFFLPTANLEIGKLPKKHIGYFFKVFFGNKMHLELENASFFGAELGLRIHLN